jgi:acetyltransferase-like isoleucine patch superfamily enzyme
MKKIIKRILHSGLPVPGFVRPVIRLLYRLGVIMNEGMTFLYAFLIVKPVIKSITRCETGLRAERIPFIRGSGQIIIGKNVNLSGRSCFYFISGMPESATIKLGNNTFIGNGCTLSAGRKISIGDDCLISAGVRMHDNDGHPIDSERRIKGGKIGPTEVKEVVIGNGAWIGANSIILKGVSIGDRAVIGTGSVVTSNVPSDKIYAGNPARDVKSSTREDSRLSP